MAQITSSTQGDTLGDILERILDKGLVIAGDITISIADIELLKIRIRLIICSVEKAQEIGIDWWKSEPSLSTEAAKNASSEETARLQKRIEELESIVASNNSKQEVPVPAAPGTQSSPAEGASQQAPLPNSDLV